MLKFEKTLSKTYIAKIFLQSHSTVPTKIKQRK